jgi:hypothetical protein
MGVRQTLETAAQVRREMKGPAPAYLLSPEKARRRHVKVKNPDGSYSSERTISVGIDGRHYNIPTMIKGKQLSTQQAIDSAKKVGIRRFPNFRTPEEASSAAAERSRRLGGK